MNRVPLQDAIVQRGGVTARYYTEETREVLCSAKDKIELLLKISSKGGGTTEVLVKIGPRDFATLIKMMCAVDRQSTMNTMAAELAREVAQQPERDAALAQGARKAVVDLAQKKVWQGPVGDRDVKNLILNGVRKLVEELTPKEKPKTKAA